MIKKLRESLVDLTKAELEEMVCLIAEKDPIKMTRNNGKLEKPLVLFLMASMLSSMSKKDSNENKLSTDGATPRLFN